MFKIELIIIVVCGHLTAVTLGLTIREVSSEDDSVVTTTSSAIGTSYRKSVAKIQETSYRVPEHLQFVPKGFIYEDADDVIHVIDPPKHFEELKKIMQRQEQHQLHNLRPVALREHRPKPKIARTASQGKLRVEHKQNLRKPVLELDLDTQETQHLPLEILASVRKTENYLRKYKPKLPSAKQRLKTKKIQTVIWEKSQEEQQYQQGHDHQLQAVREQAPSVRRYYKKRFKRAAATEPYGNTALKGEELLNHINDLIKNASYYLQQTENYEDYPDTELEATTLQGEILVKTTKAPPNANGLNEDMVVKILENSVKATNVIMQQIKTQTNLTQISEKCDYLKVTYPNHIKNLQNQIKCMQTFIKDINDKQQKQQEQPLKRYGERLEVRKAKDLRPKPFLVAQLAEDYIDDTDPSPVNNSLIYDDVMTTIRNMLQTQNLQSIEEATGGTISSSFSSPSSKANWQNVLNDSSFTYDKSSELVDFQNLQEYLISLQTIVANLPKFNHKSLNLQEVEGGSSSKYYFINPQGSIYSLPQPFQKDLTTPAPSTIFHQFPDLPIVTEYLRNGTLLPPSQQVVEFL